MKRYNKNGVPKRRRAKGIVYVIQLRLRSGELVWKIGHTTRQLLSRIQELVGDYYLRFGYIPRVDVVRSTKTRHYVEVERWLLEKSKKWQYSSSQKVEGITEMRIDVDRGELLDWYDTGIARETWEESKAKPIAVVTEVSMNDIIPCY